MKRDNPLKISYLIEYVSGALSLALTVTQALPKVRLSRI